MEDNSNFSGGNLLPMKQKMGNTQAYIVSVEDPSLKTKVRYLLAIRLVSNATHIEIHGFELEKAQADSIKTNIDVDGIANMGEKLNLWFPWQRVINVKNCYFNKK